MHTATQQWMLLLLKAITKRAKCMLVARLATLSKLVKSLSIVFEQSNKKKFTCRLSRSYSSRRKLKIFSARSASFKIEKVRSAV